MSFLGEIKRRKVFQVSAVYVITAWLIMQIVDVVGEPLNLPEWFATVVIVFLALGFPVAVIMAWAFELTPEGVVRDAKRTVDAPPVPGKWVGYAVFCLLAIGFGWVLSRIDTAPPEETQKSVAKQARPDVLPNSVAVLPLENLSLDPENEFFAAGLHDELLNQLAKIKNLNVIARTSVLQYADRGSKSIPEIAEELKVQAVMEGTVRYGGNRVRITTQLIDGKNNTHLWSQTYESEFGAANIFAIESDIATQVATALEAELLPAERAIIERPLTASTQALTLYLKARASVTDLGPMMPLESSANFHRYLDGALEADPGFALAHALKAYEYSMSLAKTYRLADEGTIAQRRALVQRHAQRALELDPNLGVAHGALALAYSFELQRTEALTAWERAHELSPGDPDILSDFSYFAAAMGQPEKGVSLARHALDVAPNSAQTVSVTGYAFIFAGDYAEAARIEQKAIALDPAFPFPYWMLGLVDAGRGNHATALENLRLAEELSRGILSADMMSQLAYGYGLIGQSEDAMRMFSQIEEMAAEFHVGAASWAMAYLGIGDEQRALDFLIAARDVSRGAEGYAALTLLAGNAFGDPVLEQPSFTEARRRLGLRDGL